ncbi:hypothetical protein [Tenacibaculum halocynthiae]|uniref:hypothetical protein n=1 Tax=Tenacibaculum halocynthiae TaxID=1254437 RepID=UPI003894EA99
MEIKTKTKKDGSLIVYSSKEPQKESVIIYGFSDKIIDDFQEQMKKMYERKEEKKEKENIW